MEQNTVVMSTRSHWSVFSLLPLLGFNFFLLVEYIIPGLGELFTLKEETATLSDISLIRVPIIIYLLLVSNVYLMVKIFKPLMALDEKNLVGWIVWCLVGGIIWASIVSFIWGLGLGGLALGLPVGLTAGFIVGIVFGIIMRSLYLY